MFNVSGLEYAKGNLFMNKTMLATPGACSAYLGTLMTEQRIANVGADRTARGISSFNQSNSWKKKDNSKTNTGHGKGKMKYVRKAGKKGSKYPPPAKKFDSKKPGQHLTKEAWMALTDDQKTASRDARRAVKEAKEAGTELSAIRTIRTITAARDGSFDASPAVATLDPAPKSALKQPQVFQINMTQCGASKKVTYNDDVDMEDADGDKKPAAKRKL